MSNLNKSLQRHKIVQFKDYNLENYNQKVMLKILEVLYKPIEKDYKNT